MKPLIIDIETAAQPLENFSKTTQEYIQEKFKKQRSKKTIEEYMTVDPDFGQVIAVGFYSEPLEYQDLALDYGTLVATVSNAEEVDEKQLLEMFWGFLENKKETKIVTFNGKSFDIPYLLKRSAYQRVKPTRQIPVKRYDTEKHLDLAEYLSGFDLSKMKKLEIYCELFGIKHNMTDGALVGEWFSKSQMKKIEEHCSEDLKATAELYERIFS